MMLVPTETPVTKPEVFTVATAGVAETHGLLAAAVPEPVSCVVEHVDKVPVIVGDPFTVTPTV